MRWMFILFFCLLLSSCSGLATVVSWEQACQNTRVGCEKKSLYEGFGAQSEGGAGGEICRVTHLGDSGTGSFRDCVVLRQYGSQRIIPRTVIFDVGGDIVLKSDLKIDTPYLTIDGSSAPAPGITVKKVNATDGEIKVHASKRSIAHDIIINHLRFDGGWSGDTEAHDQNSATIAFDGEDRAQGVYNIVLDHVVVKNATDAGGDLWGKVRNVTISWSIFMDSLHPITISHYRSQKREKISLLNNVFANNHERNPQIRGRVQYLDYINNIVYNWGRFHYSGYGVRIRPRKEHYPTDINLINNFFYTRQRFAWAIVYGNNPGGMRYPGNIYAAGNVVPDATIDTYSTVDSPVSAPGFKPVNAYPVHQLHQKVLPFAGTRFLTTDELELIAQIRGVMTEYVNNSNP